MKALITATLALLVSSSAMAANITVNGTSGDDEIYIGTYVAWNPFTHLYEPQGLYKYVNGTLTKLFPSTGANTITVNAGSGDDFVEVMNLTDGLLTISLTQRLEKYTPPPGTTVAFKLNGESGEDVIHGSDFADTIFGGVDGDNLSGRDGNDTINGFQLYASELDFPPCSLADGFGDICGGGNGNDTIHCGSSVNGGDGTDTCQSFDAFPGTSNCEVDACP